MAFVLKPKQVAKIDPSSFSPKFLLHRHLCKSRDARSYSRVHASDLMGRTPFCPREHALGLKYSNPRSPDRIHTSEQVTYDYGNMVADRLVQWYAEMDLAWGDWKCLSCKRVHSFCRRPHKCSCGSVGFKYEEVQVVSQVSGVEGHLDLLLDFGRPKLTIIEIKTMDKEVFKKLAGPLAEHRWRTNLYMRLAAESDHPNRDQIDTQEAFVLYITKGGYGVQDAELKHWKLNDGDFSPFQEYPVARDDTETEDLLDSAGRLKVYKKTGVLPIGICPTSVCKRAAYCKQVKTCFHESNMV